MSSFLFGVVTLFFSLNLFAINFKSSTIVDEQLLQIAFEDDSIDSIEIAPYDTDETSRAYSELTNISDAELFTKYGAIKINPEKSRMNKDYKYVAFLWGYLEQSYFAIEYRAVSNAVHIFRKAGWGIHIDKFVTAKDADYEFTDERNVAIWWSSHGSERGYLTVEVDSKTYARWYPSSISSTNSETKMVYLCSCYSLAASDAIKEKLPNAKIWGFGDTVTVSNCAKNVSRDFVRKFNQSI